MGKRLQLLEMGDDTARALGVNAEGSRLWLMLFGVTLTAAVTATAGPIFYRAGGAADRPPPGRTILGHPDVLGADGRDAAARRRRGVPTSFAPIQLPVGVVTVCIGGLYLIWLLIREARR